MKVAFQFFTKKGFYAEPYIVSDTNHVQLDKFLQNALTDLPEKLEGERLLDWTKIDIRVYRGDEPEQPLKDSPMIDCRSQTGITVGLIDALISIARIVAERDLSGSLVDEALKDLRSDEDIKKVLGL